MARRPDSLFETMYRELTNLLPRDQARAILREYFTRLTTVAVIAIALVVIAGGAMLVPSYLKYGSDLRLASAEYERLALSLGASSEQEVSARLSALSANIAHLTRLETTPKASAALRAVLAIPRDGITLTGFSYTPSTKPGENRMTLTGVAATRTALQRYDLALESSAFVTSSDLPLDTFAEETNLEFIITLTGTLTP